ncbi:MAG: MATE family efflux transporter [Gemmiger sp.]
MDEKKPSSGTTDLTTGRPLWRILVFALPLVLGTVFQQLYSFADTVIVGRCLGTDALAAVGSTYSLNFLILGFIQGACVGFGIPVAEAFGAKNRGDLHRYLANGVWLCAAISVVFTILTTLLAAPLLQLIHTPDDIFADAVKYVRVIFLGIPATVLYNYSASVLRSLGDSKHPFYFLLGASLQTSGWTGRSSCRWAWAWTARHWPPSSASCSAACSAPGGSSPRWRASVYQENTASPLPASGWRSSACPWV